MTSYHVIITSNLPNGGHLASALLDFWIPNLLKNCLLKVDCHGYIKVYEHKSSTTWNIWQTHPLPPLPHLPDKQINRQKVTTHKAKLIPGVTAIRTAGITLLLSSFISFTPVKDLIQSNSMLQIKKKFWLKTKTWKWLPESQLTGFYLFAIGDSNNNGLR